MKHILLIAGLWLVLSILCAEDPANKPFALTKGYLSFNYGYKVDTTQQFSIGLSPFITGRLAFDTPLAGMSYISNDPFNNGSENYSVYQVLAPAALTLADGGICRLLGIDDPGYALFFLPAVLNSSVFYFVNPFSGSGSRILIAPFLKNETDWFIMLKHDWVQISPGAGLRCQIGSIAGGVVFTAGYQRSYQNDFQTSPASKDMWFFGFGFAGDPGQ